MTENVEGIGGERPQDVPVETKQDVRVAAFGKDAVPVPYVENLDVEGDDLRYRDVRYYVAAANLLPVLFPRRKTYILNRQTVTLDTKVTSPGATIVVSNRVRNG